MRACWSRRQTPLSSHQQIIRRIRHIPYNSKQYCQRYFAINTSISVTFIGGTDPEELQKRLTERFGAKAEGVVTNNGGIDYVKLENVVTEFRAALEDRVRDRLGNSAHIIEGLRTKKNKTRRRS